MKQIIIGNGPYAQMMKNYLQLTTDSVVDAYVVDQDYITENSIDGVKVLSFEQMRQTYPCNEVELIMGIGYSKMGDTRKRVFSDCKKWGYHFVNYIHPTAIISPDAKIGEGNNILEAVLVEAGCSIGDANLFFGGGIIGHESIIGSFNTFSIRATLAGCVTIKNNCFLGVSSAVKDHCTLDDYVLLGAMAYGYRDFDKYSVVVPAKGQVLKDKISTDYL